MEQPTASKEEASGISRLGQINLTIPGWLFPDDDCHRAVTPRNITVSKSNSSQQFQLGL
jgi:hypothetical protein